MDSGEDFLTPEFLNILFFQQKNLVIYPYVDLKHLHSLEVFTASYSHIDLESTALNDLKQVLELESESSYSQSPTFYFIYNIERSQVKDVLSMDNIRCVLNSNDAISDLADGGRFVFYNKKNNHFLNYSGRDLEFENHLISSAQSREVLYDSIQKIKSTASLIFAELNNNNSFAKLPEILKDYDSQYWQKILNFTGSFFEVNIPKVEELGHNPQKKVNKKDNLQDFSDEYEVIVSTNKNIGKEFIQCLHEYRSKKVNASHLELEDLFNPLRLYNYLRNKHWKEGISETFLKDWSSMTRSQYTLTEDDLGDFNIIFEKLGVPLILINHIEENKLKNKKGKKVSSSIKRVESSAIPSIRNFPAFKGWVFDTLNKIEGLIGITPITVISNVPHSLESTDLNKKGLEKVIVDLTNILYEDMDEDRNLQTSSVLRIKNLIISKGFDPILVVDASTNYKMDDEKGFKELEKNNVFKKAPAGRKADWTVLMLAQTNNCHFITNDLYKEYKEEFGGKWIEENRITLIFVDGQWLFEYP